MHVRIHGATLSTQETAMTVHVLDQVPVCRSACDAIAALVLANMTGSEESGEGPDWCTENAYVLEADAM